jgi:mannitol/fructose-specific phosphotransferase system IIA component (Ntr-type)
MDLGDILSREQIITDLRATNRWEAIDELINNLVVTRKITPEHHDAIAAVVKKRESSMSTGIGFGIGIPHASTDLISEVVGALGRSKTGVNFDALDNQPVKLVMLFLVPQGQFQKPNFARPWSRRPTPTPCCKSSGARGKNRLVTWLQGCMVTRENSRRLMQLCNHVTHVTV